MQRALVLGQALRPPCWAASASSDPGCRCASKGLLFGHPRVSRSCCSAWSAWTGCRGCSAGCSTRVSSCRRTGCGPVGLPPGPSLPALGRRHHGQHRLRARRVNHADCSAGTPTGAARSGSRSTTWSSNALERYYQYFGDDFTIEYPTGSGQQLTLDKVAADLQDRLISIFTRGPDGRRAVLRRDVTLLQTDPALAGQPGLRRVLQRRHRRGARRLAPDRLDRDGRRHHPAAVRPGPLGPRGRHAHH